MSHPLDRNGRQTRSMFRRHNEQIRRSSINPELHQGTTRLIQVDARILQENARLNGEISSLEVHAKELVEDNKKWKTSAQQEHQNAVELNKQNREERKNTSKLEKQIIAFKHEISSTTRLEYQLFDQTIQTAFHDLFCRVRDWAFQTINQKTPDIRVTNQNTYDWLFDYVPHHTDNNKIDKVHTFVATVMGFFAVTFNSVQAFGSAEDGPVEAANRLNEVFHADSQSKGNQTSRQWLSLTRKLISEFDGDPLRQANGAATKELLSYIQHELEASSTLNFTADVRQSLETAITPGLELLQSLHCQLEEYAIEIIPAHDAGEAQAFDPQCMEDEAVEEAGWVKASLFPVLYKMINSEDGTQERVVICKARVALH